MITQDCIEVVLPVVADSWEKLRKCDVYRLLNQIHYDSHDSLTSAARVIVHKRPDLCDEVRGCVSEIMAEYGGFE